MELHADVGVVEMTYPFEQDDSQDLELFPHAPGHFCPDMSCPDKEDHEAIGMVNGWIQEGLMTVPEADDFYRGKGV